MYVWNIVGARSFYFFYCCCGPQFTKCLSEQISYRIVEIDLLKGLLKTDCINRRL